MWPVCWFPWQAQQPSDSRYFRFLWQLGKRCACWPVHCTWRFCWPLPCWPLHLPLWQWRQCVILHKCLEQWHPRRLGCLGTMGSMCCHLSVSHSTETNSPVPFLRESAPVSQLSANWTCCVVADWARRWATVLTVSLDRSSTDLVLAR